MWLILASEPPTMSLDPRIPAHGERHLGTVVAISFCQRLHASELQLQILCAHVHAACRVDLIGNFTDSTPVQDCAHTAADLRLI